MTAWVVSHEEERFINCLRKLAPKFKAGSGSPLRVLIWSVTDGLTDYTDYVHRNSANNFGKPKQVIISQTIVEPLTNKERIVEAPVQTFDQFVAFVRQENHNTLFVVKDIHHLFSERRGNHLDQVRKVRDLIHSIRTATSWFIGIATNADIPNDLEKEIQVIDMPLPDAFEVAELLDLAIKSFTTLKVKIEVSSSLREKIIFNLLGLTEVEISQVLNFTCVKHRGLVPKALEDIKTMKRQIIERGGYLQFIPTTDGIEIGGHDRFKDYVESRSLYLNRKFREHFNLLAPKGVCLVGPPGAGKSMFARYIGNRWQLPLIRLDMGAIYGEKLGESESHLRDALRIAEANAPCILWIDEIEKAIGGVSNTNDSGTSMRVFGKLLTWMSERQEMIFMYCTANNIDSLPPELTRAGRVDSIWWGDLPLEKDCIDIIKIHCRAKKVELDDLSYRDLGLRAFDKEMTGAEIEHTVIESLYSAAYKSDILKQEVPVSKEIIIQVMDEVQPYSSRKESELQTNRRKALEQFEFTSSEAKVRISKMLNKK